MTTELADTARRMGLHTDPVLNSPAERKALTARALANRLTRVLDDLVGHRHVPMVTPAITGEYIHIGSLPLADMERLVRRLEELTDPS